MQHISCNDYTYIPVAKWCLEDILKMTDYDVKIFFGILLNMTAGNFTPPNQIYVSQHLTHTHQFCTLFHELRHYYQSKTKMFDFIPGPYLKNPKPEMTDDQKGLQRYIDYINFPWELDANSFAFETVEQFWKTPLGKSYLPKPKPIIKNETSFLVEVIQADPSYSAS